MGKTMMGSTSKVATESPYNETQLNLLNDILSQVGPSQAQALQGLLAPGDVMDVFQKSIVDPSMQQYERQVLPAIQQRFGDVNAGSSSALNQALAQSAVDLQTMLGSQLGQFQQNQQANQLNAAQALNQLLGLQTQNPIYQQQEGLAGPLIGAAGTIGGGLIGGPAGAMMGSYLGNLLGPKQGQVASPLTAYGAYGATGGR